MNLEKTLIAATAGAILCGCSDDPLADKNRSPAGVWTTEYGEIYLPAEDSAEVRGAYWSYPGTDGQADNGRLIGSIQGQEFVGIWVEDSAPTACSEEKDGSRYWGRAQFRVSDDGNALQGLYSECDAPISDESFQWSGTRTL